jgi:ethanolamine kinase
MPPKDYIQAQQDESTNRVIIDDRPYLPFAVVDPSDQDSAKRVVALMFEFDDTCDWRGLEIASVTGGITNCLFLISRIHSVNHKKMKESNGHCRNGGNSDNLVPDSVLVRVFGAEGMIDRDVENATYAALWKANMAPTYWGRFANGRIEGWCREPFRHLQVRELGIPEISNAIATSVGHLHAQFQLPSHLEEYHDPSKPSMWTQLYSWLDLALSSTFQTPEDTQRAQQLKLSQFQDELEWLETSVVPSTAKVGFCHNDLLAANVLWDPITNQVQLIDFEYGGINYWSFDIANHFNEFAGGTVGDGIPRYEWFPARERQLEFVKYYLQALRGGKQPTSKDVESLLYEINGFILANHLYWGLWAVNQAATEGCQGFDYLLYGTNRMKQYFVDKAELNENI